MKALPARKYRTVVTVLVEFRNRNNPGYCRKHEIRLSGLALGRPRKNLSADKDIIYTDEVDRIEAERASAVLHKFIELVFQGTKPERWSYLVIKVAFSG